MCTSETRWARDARGAWILARARIFCSFVCLATYLRKRQTQLRRQVCYFLEKMWFHVEKGRFKRNLNYQQSWRCNFRALAIRHSLWRRATWKTLPFKFATVTIIDSVANLSFRLRSALPWSQSAAVRMFQLDVARSIATPSPARKVCLKSARKSNTSHFFFSHFSGFSYENPHFKLATTNGNLFTTWKADLSLSTRMSETKYLAGHSRS